MELQALPKPRLVVYPERRATTPRNEADRKIIGALKQTDPGEYPVDLWKARRLDFIGSIVRNRSGG